MIKAVLFDVDGVLLDSLEANWKFCSDLLEKFGYPRLTKKEYAGAFHNTLKEVIQKFTKVADESEINKIWEAARRGEIIYDENLLGTPEGLEEVLESLSKNYVLGIVSSRTKSRIEKVEKLSHLLKYFKVAVCYEDTEVHKPNPDPLLFAANKLNLKPEECAYIGDMSTDIMAARAANMKIIVFSKDFYENTDAHTEIFTELPALIEKL